MMFTCSKVITFGFVLILTFGAAEVDGRFNNVASVIVLQESQHSEVVIWDIEADCYTCKSGNPRRCSKMNVPCNQCNVTTADIFEVIGTTLRKKECVNCLTEASYALTIVCWYNDTDAIQYPTTDNVTITVYATFEFSEGNRITVSKSDSSEGSVVNTAVSHSSNAIYKMKTAPRKSFIRMNDLFASNTTSGEIYVTKTLDDEFSYTFDMEVCVSNKQTPDNEYCEWLYITLVACFQTPNCSNKSLDIYDTYGIDVLFRMDYAEPSGHFATNFSSSWQGLNWTLDDGGLNSSTIDPSTGDISLTTNISIWPAYPSKHFTQTVTVSNSDSCYSTTCQMDVTVSYTNWPPSIFGTLLASLHEDTDAKTDIYTLEVADDNYDWEDNITCEIKDVYDAWGDNDMELFELKRDNESNMYRSNYYTLYKTECNSYSCGYKEWNPPYTCPKHSGCMTYNVTQQYVVFIRCTDGYGEWDEKNLTFNVIPNLAPVYSNLPIHIDLDIRKSSQHDTVLSIMYYDNDDDSLNFTYTIREDTSGEDPGYFLTDPTGNFSNGLANITLTTYLWDKTANSSYTITICGRERRHEVCEDLTIDFEEYCGPTPECGDWTLSNVTDEFAVNEELLNATTLVVNANGYNHLHFSVSSSSQGLFAIDADTGVITTASKLPADFPSTTYFMNLFVFDDDSCGYGHCTLKLTVIPVNYAPVITNLPESVSISEFEEDSTTLCTFSTSDDNEDDTVTCNVTNLDNSGDIVHPFYIDETFPESEEYAVKNRDHLETVLTDGIYTYLLDIACYDTHGGTDTGSITVLVIPNQNPTLNELNSTVSKTVDQSSTFSGTTLFTEQVSDNEGDTLVYEWSVDSTLNPLTCVPDDDKLYINLRRNVSIIQEDGDSYAVGVCVRDVKHTETSCSTLTVTFTSEHSYPVISNLPTSIPVSEDVIVGSTLYDVDVTDDDIPVEEHVFSVTVTPDTAESTFSLNVSTGVLTLSKSLDYEDTNFYRLRFAVRDPYLQGLEEKDLLITVNDVNEQNTMTSSVSSITFKETASVGTMFDFGVTCTDLDFDDTLRFSIASGNDNDFFSIHPRSGNVYLESEWDLEGPNNLPRHTELVLRCTDSSDHTSDVLVQFDIEDVNDHSPTFTVDYPGGLMYTTVNLSKTTPIGESFLTITAFDDDMDDDNDFAFDILGSGLGKQFFYMDTLSSKKRAATINTATLKLARRMEFSNDKSFAVTVKISDGEDAEMFEGLTLKVTYIAEPPEVATTSTTPCLTCTSNGRLLLGIFVVESIIVAVLLAHFCKRVFFGRPADINRDDLDKSHNTRWQRPTTSRDVVLRTIGNKRQASDKTTVKTTKETQDHTSSSSSSSSEDSEDELKQTSFNEGPEVHRTNFPQPVYSHETTPAHFPAMGLPPPIYTTRIPFNKSRHIINTGLSGSQSSGVNK